MRRNTTGILLFFCLIVSASVAQEGFPLDGTWHGEWGSSGSGRTPVVLVMNWDGTSIKGILTQARMQYFFPKPTLILVIGLCTLRSVARMS